MCNVPVSTDTHKNRRLHHCLRDLLLAHVSFSAGYIYIFLIFFFPPRNAPSVRSGEVYKKGRANAGCQKPRDVLLMGTHTRCLCYARRSATQTKHYALSSLITSTPTISHLRFRQPKSLFHAETSHFTELRLRGCWGDR